MSAQHPMTAVGTAHHPLQERRKWGLSACGNSREQEDACHVGEPVPHTTVQGAEATRSFARDASNFVPDGASWHIAGRVLGSTGARPEEGAAENET